MKIACVIFDLDGTLVDSEGLCNQAFIDLIPELKLPLDEMVIRYRGRKLAPILLDIEQEIGRKLPTEFEKNYRERVAALFDSELLPMPGVSEMLEGLRLPICVASSGPLEKIRRALAVSSLASFFGDNIFSSYDVKSWKPDPGIFLHAAESMGCLPKDSAVVEDSLPGIEGAAAAGMKSFLYSREEKISPGYNSVVFHSMEELSSLLKCAKENGVDQATTGGK